MKIRFLACALIALSFFIAPAGLSEAAQPPAAGDQPIRVLIDDRDYQTYDSERNPLHPILVDDTLYVPLDVLTRVSGKPVIWNAAENTLLIGSAEQSQPFIYLTELPFLTETYDGTEAFSWNNEKNKDTTGNGYETAVGTKILRGEGITTFDFSLYGQYKAFSGCFFLEHISRAYVGEITLHIYGDDVLLRSYGITGGVAPIFFDDIDMAGVQTLSLQFTCTKSGNTQPTVAIGNPALLLSDDHNILGTVRVSGTRFVNVRKTPSASGGVITQIKPGSVHNCLDVADTGWYLIDLGDGTSGYVSPKTVAFTPKAPLMK